MPAHTIIQLLTMAALAGLLFASGLRLSPAELITTFADRLRLLRILLSNFIGAPLIAIGVVLVAGLPRDVAAGVLLLAAAPFAPVIPVFTRMFRGDLALAAGMTAAYPLLSSFLTPWISTLSLACLPGSVAIQFDVSSILIVLLSTITLPLVIGVGMNHWWPELCRRILRPVEVASEAIGAIALAFVSVVEWKTVMTIGWSVILWMAVVFELSVALGYVTGGPSTASRRVIGMATGNRNIALAVLIAVRNFPDSPIVASVVANGLLMILLGLLHTAWWRFKSSRGDLKSESAAR